MASEYMRKMAREQPPPEPPRELTPAEKRRNWLHYNKIWLIIGAVLLWIVGSTVWNVLGIGRVRPDYMFAYVGDRTLDEKTVAAFETQVAALGRDRNGDGRVAVALRQYVTPPISDAETAIRYATSVNVKLVADIERQESYFFLTRDPAGLQLAYQILANADGSAPENRDFGIEGKAVAWQDAPGLRELDMDQWPMADLYIGRRCFFGENAADREAENELWLTLTKGATP